MVLVILIAINTTLGFGLFVRQEKQCEEVTLG